MKQNIYDNSVFYTAYSKMRETQSGLNEVLEQPAILSLLPETIHGNILDLGCGAGEQCLKFLELGAESVVGVDISQNMIRDAREKTEGISQIALHCCAIEDFSAPEASFDFVVSSLAFHYVKDIDALFSRIHTWLNHSGTLIFSMEHPIATCSQGIHQGWLRDENNIKQCWMVDCYSDEGIRQSNWYVDGVIKYHRTISSIVNALINNGFRVQHMLEPHALECAEEKNPLLREERRRPPFLLIMCQKL